MNTIVDYSGYGRYSDKFVKEKDNELLIVSANINRL